ncbi:GntR family transcriptional regulator [Citreicella sp. C3M06]|uniref:GntR family transcriptional regulator n=1 Tax=Roseobacteraceae TaxID=2854170 RepID=UPI001C0883FF|nr:MULTISPECIES: GntR family transcriptional regulator [Roseobacteraceae]MBU2963087.1 GntR family transcriptional regulator [Citreicella sp. C3M06]MDO6588461.1 GntR family transcriptional regulator [Salipiger sp. 1_MG-2023]
MNRMQGKAASAQTVASALEAAIHDHRLPPGTRLVEDELSEIYGVSRTQIRAALQALSHRRLVEHQRNRGTFVAQPSVREAREVFEARALLEPRTARSAALRMSDTNISALQAHIDAEHAALHAGQNGRAVSLSGQFHVEIARVADQSTIEAMISQLVVRSSLIIALYWQRRSALCESHAHGALMRAFVARDGALAEELMAQHLLDLVTSLDLRNQSSTPGSLREALI